ncbi:MAG: hypothetical protein U0791_26530 [Gemmataceae bacterium]
MKGVTFQGLFFDTEKVKKLLDANELKWLNRAGGYIRQTAKRSIKYAADVAPVLKAMGKVAPEQWSMPGHPPLAHRRGNFERFVRVGGRTKKQDSSPLREMIFYGFDPRSRSVVVGPAIFRRARVPGLVPRILEHGGTGKYADKKGKIRTGTWKPRPFMRPALKASLDAIPNIIRMSR